MKHSKGNFRTGWLIWLLTLAGLGFAMAALWRLNMMPDRYLLILGGVLGIVWLLDGLLLLKPGSGLLRRILAGLLTLALLLGSAGIVTVTTELYEAMHQITQNPGAPGILTRSIFVRIDDPAQSVADTRGYTFGRIQGFDDGYTQQVLDHAGNPACQDFSSMQALVTALYDGDVDAIILSSANVDILVETEEFQDFPLRARLLEQVTVQEVQDIPTEPPVSGDDPQIGTQPPRPTRPPTTLPPIDRPEDLPSTPFVVYISGSDTRDQLLTSSRSDVNILAVVNPATHQVLLLNTPRDYYVPDPAYGYRYDKLAHCGNHGTANSMQVLSELYGIRIDYYAQLNFTGFTTLIDAIGGITVHSDVSFSTTSGICFEKGENHLNGTQALAFARERYHLAQGDLSRGQNQMKVIKAVIQKLTSGATILSRYSEILSSMTGMFSTNMTMEEIGHLVKLQLSEMPSWEILSYGVSGELGWATTASAPGMELSVIFPDYDQVDYAAELIAKIVSGQKLTQEDLQ